VMQDTVESTPVSGASSAPADKAAGSANTDSKAKDIPK